MSLVPNLARMLVIGATLACALASSSSQGERPAAPPMPAAHGAPASVPMDPALALGLWKTSFGPVKIEADETGGPSAVAGVWTYDKNGQPIVGYFQGALDGNVLQFTWHEPGPPAELAGEGYLVFDQGQTFAGKWWTRARDNGGDWNGWRAPGAPGPATAPAAPQGPVDGGPAPQPEPTRGEAEQAPADMI